MGRACTPCCSDYSMTRQARKVVLVCTIYITMLLYSPVFSYKEINLTLGATFPMSGPWAGGIGCKPAVQLAMDDINNNTSILPQYHLNLKSNDSECMAGKGTKVLYELLYNEPKKIVVLSGCSIVSTFVAQAANMWNLIVMAYGSSSPALSNRKRFPTFFRTHPSATIHNPTRVKLFQRFKWTKISTIQETQEVFTSTIEDLEAKVKDANIEIVVRQSFLTDPTNAVENLLRQDARIIVGVFYENMARRVFCRVYHAGLYGKKYVWIIIGWYPDNWYAVPDENIDCTPEQMKEALEGHLTTEAMMWNRKNASNDWGMTVQQFKDRLDKKLNITSTGQVPGYPEATLAYDAVWAIALALDKASKRLAEKQIKLENFDYTKKTITDEIYSAMNSTEFMGVSDKVRFSSEGDRIARTLIEQMRDGKYYPVGTYDYGSDQLTMTGDILWIDNKVPKDQTLIQIKLRLISQGLFCAMCTLALLGIFASVGFLVFNIVHRYHRYIVYSQSNINNLLLLGSILCLTCIIVLGLDGQFVSEDVYPKICMARAWLLAVGFTVGYGALFSKIWTVHHITTIRKADRKKINPWEMYTVICVLLLIDVVILTTWQTIDPMVRELEEFPREKPTGTDDDDILYKPELEHCSCTHLNIWLGVCYAYKGLLLLFGVFLAYETRSVKLKQVNDSRVVGMSIYNVVVMCAITAPITFIIRSQQDASYAFVSLAIILCCFLSMGLIFVPKVIQIMRHPRKESIEVKTMLDSLSNREEEEKHCRMAAENDRLKQQIAETEDKIVELTQRVRLQSHGITLATKGYVPIDRFPTPLPVTSLIPVLELENHESCDASCGGDIVPKDERTPLSSSYTPTCCQEANNTTSIPDVSHTCANKYLTVSHARVSVDLNSDSGFVSGFVSGYTRTKDAEWDVIALEELT